MRVIEHRHRVAAVAAERVHYAAHIEVLEPDHPERRFVAALCLYSHAVDTGEADCAIYDQEEAQRFARALLMPAEAFARSRDGAIPSWPSCSRPRLTRSRSADARRGAKAPPLGPNGCPRTRDSQGGS